MVNCQARTDGRTRDEVPVKQLRTDRKDSSGLAFCYIFFTLTHFLNIKHYITLLFPLSQLFSIYHSWQGCVLLLILKQFLKDYYGITEARIQNYSPQDGSKVNDKPLNRRQGVDRFNPAPALAILQKGDPEYPLDDDAKVGTDCSTMQCRMLSLARLRLIQWNK